MPYVAVDHLNHSVYGPFPDKEKALSWIYEAEKDSVYWRTCYFARPLQPIETDKTIKGS